MKPIIGITANYSYDGTGECEDGIGTQGQEWQLLADDYICAICRAGGLPMILPIMDDMEDVKQMLMGVDGVLFSGGHDVQPSYFHELPTGKCGGMVPRRDFQEDFMVKYLLSETSKPVLGICRGTQIVNASLGGTLYQHLPDAGFNIHTLVQYPRNAESHNVLIESDSILADVTGTKCLGVNSFHHMAVKKVASCLRTVAKSEDGVIEALELKDPDRRFFLCVQWHPEMMSATNAVQQGIISAFVESCKK